SRRRHTRSKRDWSSDVCSSDLLLCFSLLPVHQHRKAAVVGNGSDEISVCVCSKAARKAISIRTQRKICVYNLLPAIRSCAVCPRSEERRVGKGCRSC